MLVSGKVIDTIKIQPISNVGKYTTFVPWESRKWVFGFVKNYWINETLSEKIRWIESFESDDQLPSLKLTWHLKMDGWNTSFLLGWPIFRGYVSFRECSHWFCDRIWAS